MTTAALGAAAAAVHAGETSRAEQLVQLAREAAGRPTANPVRLDPHELDIYRSCSERTANGMVLLMRLLYDATAVIVPGRWLREVAPYRAADLATNLGAHGIGIVGDPAGDVVAYRLGDWPGCRALRARGDDE